MNLAYVQATGGDSDLPRLPGSLHVNRRLDSWLRFHAEGHVTVTPGKVELGQGILTALAQIAADELDVALARVRVRAASTPDSPNEAVTSGSLSVQESGMALRHACADARAIFLSVASQRSGVSPGDLRVEDGSFVGPNGAVGSYWTSADDALLDCEASPDARPKPAAARRGTGISAPRIDLPDKVFGATRFLHDLRLPGMLHARIVRPPARRATLLAVRDGALPGGARLVRDGSFLAVLAAEESSAEQAAARVTARAQWEAQDSLPEAATLEAWLRDAPGETSMVIERGDATAYAAPTLRRSVFRPFVAHASIGTCCAVARWTDAALEVWSHSQGIYNLRADLAKALRLPEPAIVVHHVEGAGCYGHNGADDVALDAALVARAAPGRPVRVLWSRAEELGWAPVSSAMRVEIEATTDAVGDITAWTQRVHSHGHSSRPGRNPLPTLLAVEHRAEPTAIPAAINPPIAAGGGAQRNAVPAYRIPALRVELKRIATMPLRVSALRGLGAPANVFAIESMIDELAERAGADPVAYRLRHLDDPRGRAVLERAATMAGWAGRATQEGVGLGVGYARYKNTGGWCAVVAEVVAEAEIRCRRLWIAGDVGEAINPDGIANQYEGGAIHGVSMALKEQVRFDRRRIVSDAWDSYPILRFSEVPKVEFALIARPEEPPLGAGEASLAPTIAAVAGAIHAALGVRPRRMPFTAANLTAELAG